MSNADMLSQLIFDSLSLTLADGCILEYGIFSFWWCDDHLIPKKTSASVVLVEYTPHAKLSASSNYLSLQ